MYDDSEVMFQLYLEGAAEDMVRSVLTKAQAPEDVVKFFIQKDLTTNKILFKPEHVSHLYGWVLNKQATLAQILDYYKSYVALSMPQKISEFKSFTDFTNAVDHKKSSRVKRQASKSTFDLSSIDKSKIVVDDAVVTILRADNQIDTIRFGQGPKYGFCIARPSGGNMYGNYRLTSASTFYFCYFKGVAESDDHHIAVVDHKSGDRWGLTFADNRTQEPITWEKIVEQVPALKPYRGVFINKPMTSDEREMHEKMEAFQGTPTKQNFYAFTPEQQVQALHFGMSIKEDLFDSLTPELRNEWITVGPKMSDDIFAKLNENERNRFFKVRRQQVSQRKGCSDKFDKLAAENDPEFHKQLMQAAKRKCDAVEAEIRSQVKDGVFKVTEENSHLLNFGKWDEEVAEGMTNPDQLEFFQPDLSDITIASEDGLVAFISFDDLQLTSIPKIPKGKYGLSLNLNDITSLKGLHEGITHLEVAATKITDLVGLPRSVKWLNVYGTPLKSLRGITPGVDTDNLLPKFTKEEIENAKRGIFNNKVQENTDLAKLLKQYLLMH